jgi:ketosteroid isomerase-like protein
MVSNEIDVVRAFISAINERDAERLSSLMAEDHTFVDSLGTTVSGRVEGRDRGRQDQALAGVRGLDGRLQDN